LAELVSVEQELARRELARRKLIHFCKYTMPNFRTPPYIELVCSAVDLLIDGIINTLIINLPPQVGKSEILSRKAPPYALGKNPDWRIMLTSYNASLAHTLSRQARNMIKTDEYQRVFGILGVDEEDAVILSEDSRSVNNWSLHGKRGGMLAAGVGGGLPGHAADFLIIDDPVKDDDEYKNERFHEEQEHWFWSVAYARVSKDIGRFALCQTRWSEDDLTGRLLKKQPEVNFWWYVLRIPAAGETSDEVREWAEAYNVAPEFMLTKHNIAALREMLPSERPHAKKLL